MRGNACSSWFECSVLVVVALLLGHMAGCGYDGPTADACFTSVPDCSSTVFG